MLGELGIRFVPSPLQRVTTDASGAVELTLLGFAFKEKTFIWTNSKLRGIVTNTLRIFRVPVFIFLIDIKLIYNVVLSLLYSKVIQIIYIYVAQLCPTLYDPMACSSPGYSVPQDSPGREYWSGLSFPSPEDLRPWDGTQVPLTASRFYVGFVYICIHRKERQC